MARGALLSATLGLGAGLVAVGGSAATFAANPAPGAATLSPVGLRPALRSKQVVVSPPPPPPPVVTAPPTTVAATSNQAVAAAEGGSLGTSERQVIAITNAERVAAGLAPLRVNRLLGQAATAHAMDQRNRPCQIGYLTHTGTDGSNAGTRILRTGLSISRWGENIACAHRTPESVMRSWMNSPGHRHNILNPLYTEIGVAVVASDTGQLYWVQVFAVPR